MATINPSQDYDAIHTLTFAEASGTCNIGLYRGSSSAYSGTVYYRAGTSGSWTQLDVSGTDTTFSVTSTTMQIGHSWNKSGDNYMTPSFYGQSTNLTNISISQKAVLSGSIGDYFMGSYADTCTSLTSLDVPDTSGVTSIGNDFMGYYAYGTNLTSLSVPDTSSVTSIGDYFMGSYAYGCTNLTSLDVPDTSSVTSVGDTFMYFYAGGCTNLTSLSVPDTSGVTSVGNSFMYNYARGCSNLTSLDVPDTSGITSVGDTFMYFYARDCTSLTSLILPAVGWFANHDINWSVPSGRLNYLKGYVTDSSDLTDWQDLTTSTSPNTLYINYIRSTDDVVTTPSPSISPSISSSVSPSASVSSSVSPSVSPSPSLSASISKSLSPSLSASVSTSLSQSVSPSPSEGWSNYTRGNYNTLPTDDADLETLYSAQDVLDVASADTIMVNQEATGEFAIHQFKDFVGVYASATFTWSGQSDLAPASSTVYLQIYNHSSNEWEVLTSNNLANADTNFTLESSVPDLTNYKNGNVVSCRVYQEA